MFSYPKGFVVGVLLGLSSLGADGIGVDSNFRETTFVSDADNIGHATSLAWVPDGSNRLFLTRQLGQVRIVKNGQVLGTPFATLDPIHTEKECGLLAICFDPNYVVNRYVYFFVTVSPSEQQIVRYTDNNDIGTEKTVLIRGLPTRGRLHNGGALGVGRDGKLYWGIGDNGEEIGAKDDLTSLASKVGRANLDGTVPNDNPYNDGEGPNNDYIWARGFRNPFTLAFQPVTGKLWLNVVGASGYEQIFIVNQGDHGGWDLYEGNQPAGYLKPVIQYRTNGSDNRAIPEDGIFRQNNVVTVRTAVPHSFLRGGKVTMSGVASFNGDFYVASVIDDTTFTILQAGADERSGGGQATSLNQGGSILGGTFYDSTAFPPEYWGNFFYGDYNSDRIMRATLDANNNVTSVDYFISGIEKPIDVSAGPDGALYYLNFNDGIIKRLEYASTTQNLIIYPTALNMLEGGLANFSVRLSSAPDSPVRLEVARISGSSSVTVAQGGSISFTPENWATPQVVTVAAAVEGDTANSSAILSVSSPNLPSRQVFINAIQSSSSDLILSSTALDIQEGGNGTFTVRLAKAPSADLTVHIARSSGDSDITVASGAALTFTPANFAVPQSVTVQLDEDSDLNNDSAVITLSPSDGAPRTLLVTGLDNDPLAPTIVSAPATAAVVGTAYTYDPRAVSLPAAIYSLLSSPSGMTIVPASGVITWTPTATGDFTVSIQAANGVLPNAIQAFTISVKEDAPPSFRTTKPAEGEIVSGKEAEWFGDGLDDVGTLRAEFYVDDVLQYTDINNLNHFHFGGEHLRWDTTVLSNGAHRLKVVVYDSKGQSGTEELNVVVDNRIVYEADVVPRANGNPDGIVSIADWVQIGRFAAGLDAVNGASELMRADCAPRESAGVLTRGNGTVSVADWVQAGRYAVGLDPLTTAGGPGGLAGSAAAASSQTARRYVTKSLPAAGGRAIRANHLQIEAGTTISLVIELEAQGDENAVGFTLRFDQSQLRFQEARLGSGAAGAVLQVNPRNALNGEIGLALALPFGQAFSAGKKPIFEVLFQNMPGAEGSTSTVSFADQPVRREISDLMANNLSASYESGTVAIVAVNRNPVAAPDSVTALANQSAHFLGSTLLQNDQDSDNDTLTISSVGPTSGQNGSLLLSEGVVFYQPPNNFTGTDSFSYSIIDGRGGSDTTTVTVNVVSSSVSTRSLTAAVQPDRSAKIEFRGIPGRTYSIQFSSDLSTWITIGSATVGSNGVCLFEDRDASHQQSRFYRIIRP